MQLLIANTRRGGGAYFYNYLLLVTIKFIIS